MQGKGLNFSIWREVQWDDDDLNDLQIKICGIPEKTKKINIYFTIKQVCSKC